MAVVGVFRSGKGSAISAAGVRLKQAKFDVDDSAEKVDTTNFECLVGSISYAQGLTGVRGIKYSAGGLFDAGANPYDSPPGLYPQDYFPNLYFYTNFADAVSYGLPLALILSSKLGSAVKEGVKFDWSGESNGPYSQPTGSFDS